MKQWEFEDSKEMYNLLVGNYFGANEETVSESVDQSRLQMARFLQNTLQIKSGSNGLEIGSGLGHVASVIGQKVDRLDCYDISDSFLEIAREKCKHLPNVNFFKVNNLSFEKTPSDSLDFIYSHAVFIHLNLYEIYRYLKEAKRCLKNKGKIQFEFLSADHLNLSDELFNGCSNLFGQSEKHDKEILCFNSEKSIMNMVKQLGFSELIHKRTKNNLICVVLSNDHTPGWIRPFQYLNYHFKTLPKRVLENLLSTVKKTQH